MTSSPVQIIQTKLSFPSTASRQLSVRRRPLFFFLGATGLLRGRSLPFLRGHFLPFLRGRFLPFLLRGGFLPFLRGRFLPFLLRWMALGGRGHPAKVGRPQARSRAADPHSAVYSSTRLSWAIVRGVRRGFPRAGATASFSTGGHRTMVCFFILPEKKTHKNICFFMQTNRRGEGASHPYLMKPSMATRTKQQTINTFSLD